MSDDRDARADEAIAEYLAECDAGRPPDPAAFLAKYPDLAPSLREFLDDHARMRRLAAAPDPTATVDATPAPTGAETVGFVDAPAAPGTVRYFGDYELLSEIARGGMGVVFRARQVSLNREVALKMILSGALASAADVQRFRLEAEAAANLDHPHVLPIYEVGEHQGQPYFSMKLIGGGSLADAIQRNPPVAVAGLVRVLAQVARAVDFAHRRGVLHRDLKPANVLLDSDLVPYVTDFGLAKQAGASDSGLTRTGAVVGTPSYMPPEQARGDKGVTTAADVYALGAILYEVLTGRPPFRGPTVMDTLLQVTTQEPADPRSVRATADRDLALVALKCLEKDPAKRYESAAALADDLERWARGEAVRVRPIGRAERFARWVRRKPSLAAAYGLALLLSVTAAIGTWVVTLWRQAESARDQTELARLDAVASRTQAERDRDAAAAAQNDAEKARAGEQKAREALAVSAAIRTVDLAYREYQRNDLVKARQLLASVPANRRGWEWEYVERLCGPGLALRGHRQPVRAATYSADGARLTSVGADGTFKVRDAFSGRELSTHKVNVPPGGVYATVFSRDAARTAAALHGGGVKVWETATGRELATLAGHKEQTWALAFDPSGSRLATGGDDKLVKVWDIKTGEPVSTLTGHARTVRAVAFSPDGSVLATTGEDETVRIWDAVTGERRSAFKWPHAPVYTDEIRALAFTPDGTRAVTANRGRPKVWEVKTGREVVPLSGSAGEVLALAVSPTGDRLATGNKDGEVQVWDLKTGARLLAFREHTGWIHQLCFGPDGEQLASAGADETVRVWDVRADREVRVLKLSASDQILNTVTFTPDGSRVAASGTSGARIWDARSGRELLAVRQATRGVVFDPDATRFAAGLSGPGAMVWDARTGHPLVALKSKVWVEPLGFTTDGERIVSVDGNGAIGLWDSKTGSPTNSASLGGGVPVLSPDRSHLAIASKGGGVEVWDVATLKRLRAVPGKYDALTPNTDSPLAYSPDGSRLAAVGHDRRLRLFDAETLEEVLAFQGEEATGVSSVAFSPDGRRVLGGNGLTARIWDTTTGLEVFVLEGHPMVVLAVGFGPNGQVLTGCRDGTVRIWGLPRRQVP
jgi:WD40 repeat protein